MEKRYVVELEGKRIGISMLEYADPPMGAVYGKLIFEEIASGYDFFRSYCEQKQIAVNEDDPKFKFIETQSIPELKVFSQNDIEIKGLGTYIAGMDDEGFEVHVFGVSYPFYEQEFPQHSNAYWD